MKDGVVPRGGEGRGGRAPRVGVAPLVLSGLLAGCAATELDGPSIIDDDHLVVTVLGSGTPIPSRTQAGAAILVQAGDEAFLIDCGRGCTTRLMAVDPALLASVDTVFLTHLHSDHVTGLPDLWLNGWTQGREVPLVVTGPVGTVGMMAGLRQAFAADIGYRKAAGVPASDDGIADAATELPAEGGVVLSEGDLRVTAFPVSHGQVPAYGYRVRYGEVAVAFSGDATDTPALRAGTRGADAVFLEVLSPPMTAGLEASFPPAQAARIAGIHLTPDQAADVLAASGARLGVYTHTVRTCDGDAALITATKDQFAGTVVVASDLLQVEIGPDTHSVREASRTTAAC